jgi:hypothetical protein
MIRMLVLIVAAAALSAAAALAQDTDLDTENGRYTFNRVDGEYLRLDGRTGHVSVCTRDSAGWACRMVADDRSALEAEIARLQRDNATLKKELIARNLPLPGMIKPDEPPSTSAPSLRLPNDADVEKMVSFAEKLWRRFVDMIATLQKEGLDKP